MYRHPDKFDEATKIKVLKAFLCYGESHRQIQKSILGLPAPSHGGGFVTMEILHLFGILGEHKAHLKGKDVDAEINITSGPLKKVFQLIAGYDEYQNQVSNSIGRKRGLPKGGTTEISARTKVRICQDILRDVVLLNYNYTCALCNINKPDLLVCSHIKPWAIDIDNRLNPQNAICFCAIHDRLFDKGYFSLNSDYKVLFSRKADDNIQALFINCFFNIPTNDAPNLDFLKFHWIEICEGAFYS